MKKFFLTIIALVGAVAGYAQISDGVTATLQAGETTTVFYGYDAFKDAVAAAPIDGVSTITLSPGGFGNPGDLSKNLKVYGAGFQDDTENNVSKTNVSGDLYIKSTNDITPVVRLEGINVSNNIIMSGTQTISGTEIVKCGFSNFYNRVETENTIIRQSYCRGAVRGENNKSTHFLAVNCYIGAWINQFGAGSDVGIDHCILTQNSWDSFGPYFYSNNVFNTGAFYTTAGSTFFNNVGPVAKFSGSDVTSSGNYNQTNYAAVFADGQNDLNYNDADGKPRTWKLADGTTYVGTDGSPCGVTGGDYPWNPIPATPRIIQTSVDAKSEAGKLKVTVKAEARPIE